MTIFSTAKLGAVTAVLVGVAGLATAPLASAAPPANHGVDKNGFCKPVWVGNADCWHESGKTYKTKSACVADMKEYATGGGSYKGTTTGNCYAIPPDGYYRLEAYSSACKQNETLQACRKHG
ncbi:hypothetical protein SAMN05443575_2161 [Jatrophihabitans endophyticus]|uniref:Uncharacterized protein n=1 Tax=Jatrophihabitans endophyticus TaxID=1206085 RepID=A0A1M5KJJ7_9ACTN|nr:hypothetical protein [Jatrophihabitans endophyticus]SHG52343.1 hypothetical protein SAMN05443575_2161 [Jatrophihabitans endophyticus]